MKKQTIKKESFGDRWPFTVEKGILINKNDAIIFKHNDIEYGLNRTALEQGYTHIKPIWKNSETPPSCMSGKSEIKMSLVEIINLGLAM